MPRLQPCPTICIVLAKRETTDEATSRPWPCRLLQRLPSRAHRTTSVESSSDSCSCPLGTPVGAFRARLAPFAPFPPRHRRDHPSHPARHEFRPPAHALSQSLTRELLGRATASSPSTLACLESRLLLMMALFFRPPRIFLLVDYDWFIDGLARTRSWMKNEDAEIARWTGNEMWIPLPRLSPAAALQLRFALGLCRAVMNSMFAGCLPRSTFASAAATSAKLRSLAPLAQKLNATRNVPTS
eukprot:scaffold803_cov310-Pinguiococcus_pyrenoidosus.AAC.209